MSGSVRGAPGNQCPYRDHPGEETLHGNLSELSTDLVVPGRGRALKLERTYNAVDAVAAPTPGRFGYGWTDSYNPNLTIDTSSGAVTVHQEGGATVTFTPSGGSIRSVTPGSTPMRNRASSACARATTTRRRRSS